MLGREESGSEGSSQSGSFKTKTSDSLSDELDDEIAQSEEKRLQDEKDDDSPYFVKITLDSLFLSHLEEPALVESSEIQGNFDSLMQNKVFKEIIEREIEMMFGIEKKSQKDADETQQISHLQSQLDVEMPKKNDDSSSFQSSSFESSEQSILSKGKETAKEKKSLTEFELHMKTVLTNFS